jgi:hypothetical protein
MAERAKRPLLFFLHFNDTEQDPEPESWPETCLNLAHLQVPEKLPPSSRFPSDVPSSEEPHSWPEPVTHLSAATAHHTAPASSECGGVQWVPQNMLQS